VLARAGVVAVALARLEVDRRQLPALERIVEPLGEALLLPGLVAAQPVFEQQDAVIDQLPFETRRRLQERLDLGVAGVAHHLFDPGAVVPAAVEQDDLARRRELRRVTLEIPLPRLAFAGAG